MITSQQRECLTRAEQAQENQDFRQAELGYRELIAQNIQLPAVYSQLALICAMSNRINEARQLWSHALKIAPNFVGALMGLGDICKFERNFINAIKYYDKVIVENPKFAMAYLSLSMSLRPLNKLAESEQACRTAVELEPSLLQARDYLGQILIDKGELSQAQSLYEQLISENPQNVKALYELGNLLKSQGKLAQASSCYQQAFTIQPSYSQAHFTYASIHHYTDTKDAHIVSMQEQIKRDNLPTENKIQLSFALAKAYEDVNDFSRSFRYLEQGNSLRYNRYNYTIESDESFIKNIIKTFNKEAIKNLQLSSENSTKPIFIVGMPRSGTSLVEKILSTHNKVHGAGELDYFFKLGTNNFLTEKTGFLFAPLNTYSKQQLENVGHEYLKQIEQLCKDSTYITDKLPFNMLLIGLIKIALPNAKIIHCVREPKDNCLSIFKKNFTTDNYRFAYNLKTLGQFHNLYRLLMRHWHDVFPGSIYDVHYESLVNNPETEIKKLISACDLDWQSECLRFDKSKSIVTTASAVQVRKPMYTSSVKVWHNYQDYLQPLFDALVDD